MDDYSSPGNGPSGANRIESYYASSKPWNSYDMRSYSASYAQSQVDTKESKLKKGKGTSGSFSKSWSFTDPEFQRKRRVANYKMYTVEGKMKGSLRTSFRWLKRKCEHVVSGWW